MPKLESCVDTHIVIIDDEEDYLNVVRSLLEAEGYTVLTATSVLRGWEYIENAECDVLLLDWELPGESGIDLLKRIRSSKSLKQLYVIMVTGRTETADKVAGLEAGADDYMTKPFDQDELNARIRAGIRIRQLERELAEQSRKNTVLEMAVSITDKIGNPLAAAQLLHHSLSASPELRNSKSLRSTLSDIGMALDEIQVLLKKYQSITSPKSIPAVGTRRMIDPEST